MADAKSSFDFFDSLADGLECGRKEDFCTLLDGDDVSPDYLEHVASCLFCTRAKDAAFGEIGSRFERGAGVFKGLVGQTLTVESLATAMAEMEKMFR